MGTFLEIAAARGRESDAGLPPERALAALSASTDLVAIVNEEGVIEWANQAFASFVGDERGPAAGCLFEAFVAEEDLVSLVGFEFVLSLDGASHNLLLRTPDGVSQCLLTTARFRDDHGVHVMVTCRSVSDLQTEAAAQSRQAADERNKVDALEVANRELRRLHCELERTQDSLVRASRLAGMAEIATNVLHDIGNALNSAMIATELLERQLRPTTIAKLKRALDLTCDEIGGDCSTRATKALRLMGILAERAEKELRDASQEAARLRSSMEHIRVIVRAQQEHAGSRDIAQSMSLAELVDEVLHLQREELRRQGVALTVEVEDRSCSLYRHKVAQILTNLVLNARDAAIAGERDRAVEVRGVVDEGWVVLTVHDSGPGVPPEILGRIFEHGFTTKDGGHGFGLHSSANNAQQMGGSLGSTNGGQLGGAAFRLQVPYRPGEPCPSS